MNNEKLFAYAVVTYKGLICSLHKNEQNATEIVEKFNNEPKIDGEPDPDYPYHVERWMIHE